MTEWVTVKVARLDGSVYEGRVSRAQAAGLQAGASGSMTIDGKLTHTRCVGIGPEDGVIVMEELEAPPADAPVAADDRVTLSAHGYDVFDWCPDLEAKEPPQAVWLVLNLPFQPDPAEPAIQFAGVLRMRNPDQIGELIATLQHHRDSVWPTDGGGHDPLDLEKLDDDALSSRVRRLCGEITDVDDEGAKPLRNALMELVNRWEKSRG